MLKNNRKGFTLVELLVAMAILGIIIGIALPIIRNVQGNQSKQKYDTYRNSIEQSARLYVDNYGADEFGREEEGCLIVKVSELIDKDLAKEIQLENENCADNSFVKVEKKGNRYTYTPYLACNGYSDKDYDKQEAGCKIKQHDETTMTISFNEPQDTGRNKKRVSTTITITSATGINKNSKVTYAFSTKKDSSPKQGWNNLSLNIDDNGKTATSTVLTPENTTAKYYLYVNYKNLSDSKGTPAVLKLAANHDNCTISEKNVICGEYIADNKLPEFNDTKPITGGDKFSNSKLLFNATDKEYTTENDSKDELRLCLELNKGTEKCPEVIKKDDASYKFFKNIKEGNNAKLDSYLAGTDAIEGITKAKIYVADLASNVKSQEFEINKITYDFSNGGSGCTFKYAFKGATWGKLCTPTRSGSTFKEWNTKKDGSGTTITNDTTANNNTTAYAQWNKKISELTIEFNPPEYFYDGKEKKPSIVLKDGNVTLTKDADYTVSYKNNINAGTAQIIITGTRKYNDKTHTFYSDSASKEFTIKKRIVTVTHASVVEKRLEYNGKDQNLLKNAGSCTTGGKMYWYSSNATSSSAAPTFSANNGWTATKPNEYTKKNAGTYYIYYYCYISDTNNNEGEDTNIVKSVSKTIEKKPTTLSINPTNATLIYETNGTSTITTDGDGALSCKSSDESVAKCSINGKTLTIIPQKNTADGKTATITINQAEGNNYLAASTTYSAIVNRKTLTCPKSPSDQTYAKKVLGSNIKCPTGSTEGGTTSATDADTYTQTCTANSGYKFVTACSVKWKINKKLPDLELKPNSDTLEYGTNKTSTITTDSDGALSCASNSTGVATCSISGKTLTVIPQANTEDNKKATITVSQAETNNYLAASKTYSATVNRKSLNCPKSPSDKTYNGSSQNSEITCPTGSTAGGDTTGKNANTYTQTCTANSGYKFANACSVTWKIKKKPTTISLNPNSDTLEYGTNKTSTITTDGDGTLSCTSSNENVAKCSISGKTLTIIPQANTSDGKKATITVSQAEGTNYLAASATYSATINRKPITTCPNSPSDKTYNGSSQNSGITCPTGSTAGGDTTGKNANTYTQTCTANSGYNFGETCNVTWKINKKPTTISLNPNSDTLEYGTNKTSTITTDGDGALSCTSSNETVAKCSISGKTLTIIPQANTADNKKATITVSQAEGTNYLAASATYSAIVNRKSLNCPSSPSDKTYNGASQNSGITCPTGSTAGGDTTGTAATTYTQTCRANSGYNFGGTCNVSWKINKRTVTIIAPTVVSTTLTYNGSDRDLLSSAGSCSAGGTMYWYNSVTTSSSAPTFSTTSGWTTTSPSTTKYKGKDAGTYYIWYYCRVTDTTNNTGTNINTVNYVSKSIGKANGSCPTSIPSYEGEYDGNAHSLNVPTGGTGGSIQYKIGNGSWTNWTTSSKPSRTEAGTTTVSIKRASNNNYNEVSDCGTTTIKINQSLEDINGWRCYYNDGKDGNWYHITKCQPTTVANPICYYDQSIKDTSNALTSSGQIKRLSLSPDRYCTYGTRYTCDLTMTLLHGKDLRCPDWGEHQEFGDMLIPEGSYRKLKLLEPEAVTAPWSTAGTKLDKVLDVASGEIYYSHPKCISATVPTSSSNCNSDCPN